MKKITFFLFGLIALVACEAELETEKANSLGDGNRMTRSSLTISPEEAAAQALEFRNDILEQSGQTRGQKAEKGVASVYAWRSSEIAPKSMTRSTASELLPDTLLYIVNFEDSCGYALVSADALVPGVAAYIEKGNLSPNQEIDNPGFKSFLEGYGKYICDSIRSISDSLRHHEGTLMFMDTAHVTGPEPYTPYRLIYYVAPLLTTEWGQGAPYNNECPIFGYELHCVAGCVAVAAAQVVAYHRYPNSYNGHIYNWDAILSESTVSNSDPIASQSVAELIHDIGVLAQTSYYYPKSTANFPFLWHCWEAFGYQYYRPDEVPTFNAIKDDISNGRPVVMCGSEIIHNEDDSWSHESHAWVVDGVAVKRHRFANYQSFPDREYIHCNWGWDGDCNGYFILGAFETRYYLSTDYGVGGFDAYNKAMQAFYSVCPIN